jgi:glucose/arabinose dehydrogenase
MHTLRLFTPLFFVLVNVCFGTEYSLVPAFPGQQKFSSPIEVSFMNDASGRVLVVEQRGRVFVMRNIAADSSRSLFLDLRDTVSQSGSEMGLLGLALHPRFSTNGYFFVNYTTVIRGQLATVISRFTARSPLHDSVLRATEMVLFTVAQPYQNHNGGSLAFGPDGYLYIGLGDGGSGGDPANNAQSKSVFLGKIHRIDVDHPSGGKQYGIPATNPFAGNDSGFVEEIYAYGLRNPWRFSFDRTGTFWVADVGQNVHEEIDTVINGGNYGWRIKEGFYCYNPSANCDSSGLISPLYDYPHANGNVSVTGGVVYRGADQALNGAYIFGDYGSGRIWALQGAYSGNPVVGLLIDRRSPTPVYLSTFAQDTAGDVYAVSYSEGAIYHIASPASGVQESTAPMALTLGVYPNPVADRGRIVFSLDRASHVRMRIVDALGRVSQTLVDAQLTPGSHECSLPSRSLHTGLYRITIEAGGAVCSAVVPVVQ